MQAANTQKKWTKQGCLVPFCIHILRIQAATFSKAQFQITCDHRVWCWARSRSPGKSAQNASPKVHKAWNYRSHDPTWTKELPLPRKRAPPGADPYTAGCPPPLPSRQIRMPPSHPQQQPSLSLPLHPSLSTCHLEIPKSTPDQEGPKKICHKFAEGTKLILVCPSLLV